MVRTVPDWGQRTESRKTRRSRVMNFEDWQEIIEEPAEGPRDDQVRVWFEAEFDDEDYQSELEGS
jgi:hypothetical protein